MSKYVLAFTILVVFCVPAEAQISFDAAATGEVVNGTSVSYSHTVTGTSALLVVGVYVLNGTELVNTPTYNGAPLTLIDKVMIGSPQHWVYQYALANAPEGSHTLSVTTSSAVSFAVVSASYRGVVGLPQDNSTHYWTPVGESPISATTTLTPNSNNTWTILVGVANGGNVAAGSGSTMRASTGQLNWWPYTNRLGIFDSDSPISPAAAKSMTITGTQPYTEFGTVMASYAPVGATTTELPLLYSHNLAYMGGFRVPFSCGSDTLAFGGNAIAFSPTGDGGSGSLYIASRSQNVAEISIPQLVDSATVADLNTAQCIRNFVEPTEGAKYQEVAGAAGPTGMAVVAGQLWINNGIYYNSGATQSLSIMARPLDLTTSGQVSGLYGLTSNQSGFMTSMAATSIAEVSSDWATQIGGNLFLSKFNRPVITSQSYGPNAIVTHTDTLSGAAQSTFTAAATPLFYPGNHTPTGDDGGQQEQVYTYFSQAHDSGSLVQPKGTSSLLVFQVAGATKGRSEGGYGYGYGCGCSTPGIEPGQLSCPAGTSEDCIDKPHFYDPERSGAKGTHGYPYVYQVVAYDMRDLVDVKNSLRDPWNLRPYPNGIWEIQFRIMPTGGQRTLLSNATYDSATNRIYIGQLDCCDRYGEDLKPIIHVFQVNP